MLTIHKLTHINDSEEAANVSTEDREDLLSQGEELVRSVFGQEGWNVVIPRATPLPTFVSSRTFTYKKRPPSVSRVDSASAPLREWGDLGTIDDDVVLSKLEAFQSMDVSRWLTAKRRQPKRPLADDTAIDAPSKKRRKTDDSSLYGLIPRPHHHSYPRIVPKSIVAEDVTKRFLPYSKSPVKPVAPYTLKMIQTYLDQPFARSAWIVPVCGHTPWEAASSATLGPAQSDHAIAWTPAVLREFWDSLLRLRERGVLGAVSLSYHVAAPEDTEGVLRCTHIKIYHDVRFALYVRAVLDGWYPQVAAAAADGREVSKAKVRPLLRKTLAIVDERGIAIGVC